MDTTSTPYRVHQCFKCSGVTQYYCVSCPCVLCPQCKENHVKDLQTIDHDVVSYRDNVNYTPRKEICMKHPSNVYIKYCEPCQVPLCNSCSDDQSHIFKSFPFGQEKHRILDIQIAYETKRQQYRGTIHTIRSKALLYIPFILPRIKADFKTCQTKFFLYQSEFLTKAQKLKKLIENVKKDFICNVFCDFDFKHRCFKQKKEMTRHIVSIQRYVHRYEQRRVIRPLQFLSSIKAALTQIHLTLHTNQLSMTESFNKENVIESLSAIQITKRGNRPVGNEFKLDLMPGPEFLRSLTLIGVNGCGHISYESFDRVWVSDENNIILMNPIGVPLHRVDDLCGVLVGGLHTVNSESELIYIDKNFNINKLSKDMETTTTYIERTNSNFIPLCVYWSPSTGELLIGIYCIDTETCKVTRYNHSGKFTQTISHGKTGRRLYSEPIFITENNNGDVGAVVVTARGGRHRFSYRGPTSGSRLRPHGICTDALSHILVCDIITDTVQMIDGDGHFLLHLLTISHEIGNLHILSYDINTHRLWVGSQDNNKVCVYRYITRKDALTDQSHMTESQSEIPTKVTKNPQQINQCLLKLMTPPKLLYSLAVTGLDNCFHITCVTSDRVWVSDDNKLNLTNTTGVRLQCVEDLCCGLFSGGSYTVNSESELIYIDTDFNINKISKDMETTTTYIEGTNSTWRPRCVYSSPSTGDVLVGIYCISNGTGKVTRYNQSKQLTQTIQHNNRGRWLYSKPNYITENNNGDVVVSDLKAVKVTDCGERHRFSYTGHPSGSRLKPLGICTDTLSHILVCDYTTQTVQMLNKDGQFLSHLLTESQNISGPWSLSYDVNTHNLWVGSRDNNKVCVYRYISKKDALTDENEYAHTPDGDVMFSSTTAVEWR